MLMIISKIVVFWLYNYCQPFFSGIKIKSGFIVLMCFMIVDCASQYGSPNIHDQHRDMRMDIDNMSYEVIIFVSCVIINDIAV